MNNATGILSVSAPLVVTDRSTIEWSTGAGSFSASVAWLRSVAQSRTLTARETARYAAILRLAGAR